MMFVKAFTYAMGMILITLTRSYLTCASSCCISDLNWFILLMLAWFITNLICLTAGMNSSIWLKYLYMSSIGSKSVYWMESNGMFWNCKAGV